jgi:hypothetical protein
MAQKHMQLLLSNQLFGKSKLAKQQSRCWMQWTRMICSWSWWVAQTRVRCGKLCTHEQSVEGNISQLQEKFYRRHIEYTDTVSGYVNNLSAIWWQLVGTTGQFINDQQLMMKITCRLPESYDALLLAWHSVMLADQSTCWLQRKD